MSDIIQFTAKYVNLFKTQILTQCTTKDILLNIRHHLRVF